VLKHVLLGSGLAFAAAIQPGPLQAFLLARAVATGWRRTLPACLSPLLSDGPIALVSLVLLSRLPSSFHLIVRAAGGLLLLYFAGATFLQWRRPTGLARGGSAPRTLLQAALVNVLNPNPYLGWSLVLGPAVLAAWREHEAYALALVGAFYVVLCLTTAAFVLLVGTSRFLGPAGRRALVAVSAAVLASLGLYLLASSLSRLAGP
jgi:threonine/homoserine/homoserine lactone efflux protein